MRNGFRSILRLDFPPSSLLKCAGLDADMPPSNDPFYAGLGQAVRIGTELLAALIVGGGLGWAADTYLFASGPWGMVIGLIVGATAGIRNVMRAAQNWSK